MVGRRQPQCPGDGLEQVRADVVATVMRLKAPVEKPPSLAREWPRGPCELLSACKDHVRSPSVFKAVAIAVIRLKARDASPPGVLGVPDPDRLSQLRCCSLPYARRDALEGAPAHRVASRFATMSPFAGRTLANNLPPHRFARLRKNGLCRSYTLILGGSGRVP